MSFPALGGTAVVAVSDASRLLAAREAVTASIEELDRACSRFRPDSEISALNAAAGSWHRVSPLLFDAIRAALRAARLTDGDVDPTVGRALIALGYDRDFDSLSTRRPAVTFAAVPGWRTVALDDARSSVRLEPGVMLDLGATAKALGADLAAARAAQIAGCGVLVGLSGDIAMAGPPPQGGWSVRVTDDHRSGVDAPGQTIALRTGGLATSSTTTRRWPVAADGEIVDGGEAHHLIDPRSGRPVEAEWRTVSVAAASCLDANIASTASIVRGDPAAAWLQETGLPSRLVAIDGTVRHVAGWPSAGDDLQPAHPRPVRATPHVEALR